MTTKWLRTKLFEAGLIQDSGAWEWLLDPENRDLVMKGDEVQDYGLAWYAGFGGVRQRGEGGHNDDGGLRCSLRGQRS
mgnify:FL=1